MNHIRVGDYVRFLGIKDSKGLSVDHAEDNRYIGEVGKVISITPSHMYPMGCQFEKLLLSAFRANEIELVFSTSEKIEDYM